MKRLLLALLLVPSLALAADEKTAAPSGDPMAGWVPPKVKHEAKDKQEITAVFKAMDAAGRTGDLDAAVALVDFPVMMMTDDSKGEAMGEPWNKEQWVNVMKPMYEKPMKDMKLTHKPTIFLISDSLASVDDVCTMTIGGKTITSRNSSFLIRRDGKWRMKAMAEGGWGDMMAASPQGAASASPGTGSSQETGSWPETGSSHGASQGTGTAQPQELGSKPAGTEPPAGGERTTK